MHHIEPYFNWIHLYNASEDELSPFYGVEPNLFEYTNQVYNYYIHPDWNDFGSNTLYLKVLYVNYGYGEAIIEFIGEWNDAVENDIMQLKRELIDVLLQCGISKYVLICENVMNFHADANDYYQEWNEEIEEMEGYVVMLNMPNHCIDEMKNSRIAKYFFFLEYDKWRIHKPQHLMQWVNEQLDKLLQM